MYSTYGLTGSGIKIGVISNGMNYWQDSKNNGDLPTFVYAVDNTNNTTNYPESEGTAMMEIVHDIAPNAELWFGGIDGSDTPLDFANRVTHLKEQDCKIIVDDLGWITGYSYFQENEISTAIRQFIQNNNGCYISACGNDNGIMYSGVNYTVESDNFLKFNNSTTELTFTANFSGELLVTFQWADDWFVPVDDYDLYVYDNNNQNLLTQENRSPNFPPEEFGSFDVTEGFTYKIKIKWYDYVFGSSNREIKILLNRNSEDITMPLASTEKQVFGHPITSEVISTAATDVTDPLNVEDFSSRGPAMVYFSGSGTTISVQQPKITAADGVETFVGQSGNFGNPFSGTSAAAPHIAGIAALYYEGFPTDGYSEFLTKIKNTSVTMNDGGSSSTWSKVSGFGRADAYSAIEARIAENYVNVTVNQLNSQGTNVETADIWQSTLWENFAVPKSFIFPKNSTQVLRSNQSIINNEKYHDWNSSLSDVTNHKSFIITTSTNTLDAFLLPTNNVQIKNAIEGTSVSGGNIGFKDPWLIDDSDSKGSKNRGTVASALWYDNLSSPFTPSTSSNYKGVFLNQNPAQTPTYYSIRVPSTQTINGSVYYFQNWSASGANVQSSTALETPVVFTSSNAVVNANYKGPGLSNNSNAYANNGQRKFVRTNGGVLYRLYESMNRIWIEKSTDNGSTWVITNNGMPISNNDSKNPSMCLTYGESFYIVFEDYNGYGYIKLFEYTYPADVAVERCSIYSCTDYQQSNSNPVVTYCFNEISSPTGPVIIWKLQGDGAFCNDPGLYYAAVNSSNWTYVEGMIPNTDINSYNPSVAGFDPIHDALIWKNDPMIFNLAWEQRNGSNSSVMFNQVERVQNNTLQLTQYQDISSGSGYSKNYNPSIITIKDAQGNFSARLCWIGYRYSGGDVYRTVFKSSNYYYYWNFGNSVRSVNINKTADGNYIAAWGQVSGGSYANYYVRNSTLANPKNFGTTGKDIQVNNGSGYNSLYASLFQSAAVPYSFSISNSVGSIGKVNSAKTIASGREAVLYKDDAQFYFGVGDIVVDGNKVEFVELSDSAAIDNLTALNNYLVTEPFETENNFTYSIEYGITDSSSAVALLTGSKEISFKVQLIEEGTGNVLGEINNVVFNEKNISKVDNISHKVNTANFRSKTVRLRLIAASNFDVDYSFSRRHAEGFVLGKSFSLNEVNLETETILTDYDLSQNYPNPFNPSTIIKYQLPENGFVTLKVYDILGKEVKILVNEFKPSGRYEITFDGSNLASGVYVYKLDVNNFSTSRKLILMK